MSETVYVWHGRGSSKQERQAALAYAKSLSSNIVELHEDDGTEEEMFWIILGEGEYGKADYWRWKAAQPWITRLWMVDSGVHRNAVRIVRRSATVPQAYFELLFRRFSRSVRSPA